MTTNEFENMYRKDNFNEEENITTDQIKEDYFSNDDDDQEDYSEGARKSFDFSKASDTVKGPERVNLHNKIVIIEDIDLKLPNETDKWYYSDDGLHRWKKCIFKLMYDYEGQVEYYSGVSQYDTGYDKGKGTKEKLAEPTIANNPPKTMQASILKNAYAKYKGKKIEQVSMKEFWAFLLSKPKGRIEWLPFEYKGKITNKNIIVEFVN